MSGLWPVAVLAAISWALWIGTRCRRGRHAPDPTFATMSDGRPAWECPRCLRRYPRTDCGNWRPWETRPPVPKRPKRAAKRDNVRPMRKVG